MMTAICGAKRQQISATLGVSEARVENVIATIQGFDPPGVCARNLAECLSIQLAQKNRLDPAMETLLANLDLLARRDFAELTRLCGVDREDMAEMVQEIRELEPRPGSAFDHAPVQAVSPDVHVGMRPDGSWAIELNPETLPRVLVSRSYHATVSRACRNEAEKTFMADCLQNANWLVRSLDQRAQTILEGGQRDREAAGHVPGAWRAAFAAAEPQDGRRRHQDA